MRKGEIFRAILFGMALVLAVTGNWVLLVFGAVVYQLTRVATIALERRSRKRRAALRDRG